MKFIEVKLGEVYMGKSEVSTSGVKCSWVKFKWENVKCRQAWLNRVKVLVTGCLSLLEYTA